MTEPEFPTDPLIPDPRPSAEDKKPRKAAEPPKVTAEPDAPFGWTVDRVTGEKRPKKTPGRQATKAKAVTPPRKRAANAARVAKPAGDVLPSPAIVAAVDSRTYADKIGELCDSAWMLAAAVPVTESKLFGRIDLKPLTMRAKAQAEVIAQQKPSLVSGLSIMAEHSPVVAKGVDFLTKSDGPAWILPAMMALAPFAMASADIWRAEVSTIEVLAKATQARWEAYMGEQQAAIKAAQQAAIEAAQAEAAKAE